MSGLDPDLRRRRGPLRRATLLFLFVTVVLDILAIGIVIPVLPHLIERLAGGVAQAALWVGAFGSAFALAQFLASPVQGALGDRFGRRPVILLSNLGLGFDFLLMALAGSLPVLFLGRVLAGLTSASVSTAHAYIADIVPPERRAASYGLLGAAFGLGFVVGPALGGLLGGIELRLPFQVAAGLSLANFLYGLLILPESLPRSRRTPFRWRRAHPLASVRMLRGRPRVGRLATVLVLSQFAHYALPSVFVLYAAHRYGWGETRVGGVLALVGICNVLVQAVGVRRWVPRIGERRGLLLGLACGGLGFAWQGLAPDGATFLASIPLMALWGLVGPCAQSLMTREVDAGDQGKLQGAVTGLVALTGVFAPTLFTQVFAAALRGLGGGPWSGLPFLASAALLGLAWWIASGIPDRSGRQLQDQGRVQGGTGGARAEADTERLERATDPERA